MNVLIRVDANAAVGAGHVMRCAALGKRLMSQGAQVHFVCVGLSDRLADWLRDRGFSLTVLSVAHINNCQTDLTATSDVARRIGRVDLLIVDHYGLNHVWENGMRSQARRILVIDDLADRDHDCDILLDHNLHEAALARYENRVPPGTRLFLGPRYAILRTEFDEPSLQRVRNGDVSRLLVFFGGDENNETLKVVNALRALGSHAPETIVVLGLVHPHQSSIHKNAADLQRVQVIDTTDQMSVLIAQADLAIGTCGVAAWERCVLGLPCLVVVTAENQREDAEILHRIGAVEFLGDANKVSVENWKLKLQQAIDNPTRIRAMASAAREVMAGRKSAIAELEKSLFKDAS